MLKLGISRNDFLFRDLGYENSNPPTGLQASYSSFWARRVLAALAALGQRQGSVSVAQLSEQAALHTDDVFETLQSLKLLQFCGGQHAIKAHPEVSSKCVPGFLLRNVSPTTRAGNYNELPV